MTERRTGPIQKDSLLKAIDWQVYLHSHARRIYTLAQKGGLQQARALASRIEKGKLKDQFTCRDVYQMGWTGQATPDDVRSAADVLIDYGWIRAVPESTGGRPTVKYRINPQLLRATK